MNSNDFSPDNSGQILLDNVTWDNVTNYIYASIVDCSSPTIVNKFTTMPIEHLRESTKRAVILDCGKKVNHALEKAYKEKFKDPDLKSKLLETGTVKLKAKNIFDNRVENNDVLMQVRNSIIQDQLKLNTDRDTQIYIRRVKQAARIYTAMIKMLYEGNSLEKFRHFSIASIPTELAHTGEARAKSIEKVAPEIKSAALSMNGNILYNLVRKNELRKYHEQIELLKGACAKNIVSSHILDTRYPHFYKECVAKNTGELKSTVYSIKLSLENTQLNTKAKRERIDALEKAQNKLKDQKSKLTKARVYKKHAELLNSIPDLNKKVWLIYNDKKFPPEVQVKIEEKLGRIYIPTALEIEQAESWTHRCQVFKPSDSTLINKHSEIGEYVISKTEFPELTTEYEIQMTIESRCYSSAAHFVLYTLIADLLSNRYTRESSESRAENLLRNVDGYFIGLEKGAALFEKMRDEHFELKMRAACEKGIAEWIASNPKFREKLIESKRYLKTIEYNSPNPILGVGTSTIRGQNLVGETLMNARRLI